MRRLILTTLITALGAATLSAQQAPPSIQTPPPSAPTPQASAQAPAPPPRQPRAPQLGGSLLPAATNVKLDMTITDSVTGAPVKKLVSLVMLNGNGGMIRTQNSKHSAELNVDAVANAYVNGLVSVQLTFEYTPPLEVDAEGRPRAQAPRLHESITVVLTDGKPMVVSQSADPATDRKVTVELTATVLK